MKNCIKTAACFFALAISAACNNDVIIKHDNNNLISFDAPFVNNSTRADAAADPSYTSTNLGHFNVYGAVNGVNIFNGNEVTKDDNANYGDPWTLVGNKQYWINGANYVFVAVVDGNKSDVTTTNIDSNTGIPTTIDYTVDGATDLLCDRVVRPNNTDTSTVAFDFSHLLSKVKFSVKNTSDAAATNYRIVLTKAEITGVYSEGVYSVVAGTWTATDTMEYTLENLTVNSGATQYHSSEVLLIPGNNVGVVINANIEATADGTNWKPVSTIEKTFENVLGTGNTLVANNAYHFAVTLGIGTEIKFTANQLPDWNYDINGDKQVNDNDNISLN